MQELRIPTTDNLFEAIEVGNILEIQRLVNEVNDVNAYVNSRNQKVYDKRRYRKYLTSFEDIYRASREVIKEYTPLMFLAEQTHQPNVLLTIATILLDKGARLDLVHPYSQNTVLHVAAYNRHHHLCNLFIDRGANIEARDGFGRTPLILAAIFDGNAQVIETLVARGAEINAVDNITTSRNITNGQLKGKLTALHYSAEEHKLDNMQKLIECDADLYIKTADGRTFLELISSINSKTPSILNYLGVNSNEFRSIQDALDEPDTVQESIYTPTGKQALEELSSTLQNLCDDSNRGDVADRAGNLDSHQLYQSLVSNAKTTGYITMRNPNMLSREGFKRAKDQRNHRIIQLIDGIGERLRPQISSLKK